MTTPTFRLFFVLCLAFTLGGCASSALQTTTPSSPRPMHHGPSAGHAPRIVAHRGGTADAPENTLLAIATALRNGADMMWLSVQLSADGVPVLYRPRDLSALTNRQGAVSSMTLAQLQALNAGFAFRDATGAFPYRTQPQRIPTLAEALAAIPASMPVMLDMKAEASQALVDGVAAVLASSRAWNRVWLYSTDAAFAPLWARHPQAQVMETRDATRQRLLDVVLAQRCEPPTAPGWAGFEVRRNVEVSERFTLGVGRTSVKGAQLWTPEAMACFRSGTHRLSVMWFIDGEADYRQAAEFGVDAVMVNSPREARQWRANVARHTRP
ncbi:MAG TPA: glycerophosphodiester phosphodiesterase family protein [Stenotrophomonas sp.]|nr:glycerophosphodiester phosphodiesterase family protein [Stenotrophomonas sp.]